MSPPTVEETSADSMRKHLTTGSSSPLRGLAAYAQSIPHPLDRMCSSALRISQVDDLSDTQLISLSFCLGSETEARPGLLPLSLDDGPEVLRGDAPGDLWRGFDEGVDENQNFAAGY